MYGPHAGSCSLWRATGCSARIGAVAALSTSLPALSTRIPLKIPLLLSPFLPPSTICSKQETFPTPFSQTFIIIFFHFKYAKKKSSNKTESRSRKENNRFKNSSFLCLQKWHPEAPASGKCSLRSCKCISQGITPRPRRLLPQDATAPRPSFSFGIAERFRLCSSDRSRYCNNRKIIHHCSQRGRCLQAI